MAGGTKPPTIFGLQTRRGAFVETLTFAAYVLVVLGPMLLLIGKAAQAALSGQADWLRLAVPTGRTLTLFLNSLILALAISAVSMCLGWLGATMFWIWRSRTTTPIIWIVLPLAALPPYIHALAWLTLSSTANTWLRTLGWSAGIGQGWASALWVGTATYAPLALGFAWLGLRSIDPDLIDAGRQVRPDLDVLLRIVLPLSIPATLTAGGIIFLLNILDYSVPYLFQVNVYAMEVFAEYSASNLPERASLIAIPLIVIAAVVLVATLEPLRTLAMREVRHRPVWDNKPSLTKSFLWLGGVACALLTAQALLPIVMLVSQGGAPKQFLEAVGQARAEVSYSFWTAAVAALLSLPLALGVARSLLRTGSRAKSLWFLVVAPVALPASLVGIGWIYILNHPALQQTFIPNLMPALAAMARFMPLAVLVLVAQMRRTDPLLAEAALVFQPVAWRRNLQVSLPLLAPGLLAAGGLTFALSMGELGATLMVAPPGKATLTMRIYNYMHYGASDTVAGLCLLMATCVLLAGALAAVAGSQWSRLFKGPEVGS